MAELVALSVTMKGAGDEDLMRLRLPITGQLVGVSVEGSGATGSPTGGAVSVTEETLDEIASVTMSSWRGDWLSHHLGGAASPVPLNAGASLGVRLYLNGGTTPTLNLTVSLWMVL